MSENIGTRPYQTPEFRAWLRAIVHREVRRYQRPRAYLYRFFTCWVAEDPEPDYSTLDRADRLGLTDPVTSSSTRIGLPVTMTSGNVPA